MVLRFDGDLAQLNILLYGLIIAYGIGVREQNLGTALHAMDRVEVIRNFEVCRVGWATEFGEWHSSFCSIYKLLSRCGLYLSLPSFFISLTYA